MNLTALQLASKIQESILTLYGEYLTEDGKGVNYEGLKKSPLFSHYVNLTAQLQFVDLSLLPPNELKAFVINIYNALVIHGTAVLGGFDASIKGSIGKFFTGCSYVIGKYCFSLDELEHGILRANAIHPTSGARYFADADPRSALALPLDPRIHFALVCGAKSCPPIRIYNAGNIEVGLDLAATAFLSDVTINANKITMSKILFWYGKDFSISDEGKLLWISKYVKDEGQRKLLEDLISKGAFDNESNPSGFVIEYSEYNWGVNSI
jgi:hypothetical protein